MTAVETLHPETVDLSRLYSPKTKEVYVSLVQTGTPAGKAAS